jgi:RHS repeat-associated protein
LGSTSLVTDASGNIVSELRYRPWGETRYNSGSTPTRYQYTGQYSYTPDFGLYFYNARWYDPLLGRFAQPDSLILEQSQGAQVWDRYAYVNNNPVRHNDPTGHCPWCIAVGAAIIILKIVDYGWTAYDAWQSARTLSDPNATDSEKAFATASLATTVAFEAAEPDDLLPLSLPLDDLARHGIIKLGKEAGEEAAEQGFKSFTARNFRENLMRLTGKSADEVADLEAHHVFPQALELIPNRSSKTMFDAPIYICVQRYCILRSGKTRNELSDSGLSTCGRVKQDGLAKSATEFSEDALQRAGRA